MSRDKALRRFLILNYLALYLVSLAINCGLGALVLIRQLDGVQQIFTNRISNAISLQKNELLNELALGDQRSLAQHLELMRLDLGVDRVTVVSNDLVVDANVVASKRSSWLQVLRPLMKIGEFRTSIVNDFSDLQANILVNYEQSFMRWLAWPLVKLVLSVFFTSMITTGALFLILFKLLDKRLIRPLEDVTDRLATGNVGLPDGNSSRAELLEIIQLKQASMRFRELGQVAMYAQVARQIAHDVRSPLSALTILSQSIVNLPDAARELLKSAIDRIEEIAIGLIASSSGESTLTLGAVCLTQIIVQIVEEKRIQYRGKPVDYVLNFEQSRVQLVIGNATELKRVVSNLLQNSLEALDSAGTIWVSLQPDDEIVRVKIQDDGKGMPAEVVANLGEGAMSYGKDHLTTSGNGLGLSHAFKYLKASGGKLTIESEVGVGTSVTISLRNAERHVLHLRTVSHIVIVDDDKAVHELWALRFDQKRLSELGIAVENFLTLAAFETWLEQASLEKRSRSCFLVDYDFQDSEKTGLSTVKSWRLSDSATLVTNRAEEVSSLAPNLKVVPKNLIPAMVISYDE